MKPIGNLIQQHCKWQRKDRMRRNRVDDLHNIQILQEILQINNSEQDICLQIYKNLNRKVILMFLDVGPHKKKWQKCKFLKIVYNQFITIQMDTFNSEELPISFLNHEQNKYYSINHILEQNKFLETQKQTIKKQKRIYRSNEAEGKPKLKKPVQQGIKIGHWSKEQKKRYHWFLQVYHSHFQNKQMRRMDKIFKTMADFLGSRAADQCRSHHQKMQKKYKTFYYIIFNLRSQHYQSIESDLILKELKMENIVLQQNLIKQDELMKHLEENNQQPNLINQNSISLERNSPKYEIKKMNLQTNLQNPLNFFHQLSEDFLI